MTVSWQRRKKNCQNMSLPWFGVKASYTFLPEFIREHVYPSHMEDQKQLLQTRLISVGRKIQSSGRAATILTIIWYIDAARLGPRTLRGSCKTRQEHPWLCARYNQIQVRRKWEQSLLKTESVNIDRAPGRLRKDKKVSLIFA